MSVQSHIDITRMKVYARHGVLEQERRVGNAFEVSIRLYTDIMPAAKADDVDLTVNYAEVADTVAAVMSEPCRLLETVCARIREAITARWPAVTGGIVTIYKLHPPFPHPVAEVSVTLEW